MEKKPKVTVIIATYNSGKTIRRSIDSLKQMAFDDWECLIVDGNSTDNTIEIVTQYQSMDNRFRYISEPDSGIYDAFNKGWKNAQADWVYFLGSDDIVMSEGFCALVNHIDDTDAAILSAGVQVSYVDGSTSYWEGSDGKPAWGCHQGMLINKEAIRKAGGFNKAFKVMGDKDLNVRILMAGNHVQVVPGLIVANFAMTGSSRSFSRQLVKCKENYLIAKMGGVKNPRVYALKLLYGGLKSKIYRGLRKLILKTNK